MTWHATTCYRHPDVKLSSNDDRCWRCTDEARAALDTLRVAHQVTCDQATCDLFDCTNKPAICSKHWDDEKMKAIAETRRAESLEAALAALPAAIRALPFTPDTTTGTRQAAMREAAAKLAEEALAKASES